MFDRLDKHTTKAVMRKTPLEDVPKDCRGCGACCGPCLEYIISRKDKLEWDKGRGDIARLRGMGLANVEGSWWITTPSCPHLKDGVCQIYETRPKVCSDFKPGSEDCRLYLYLKKNENGRL